MDDTTTTSGVVIALSSYWRAGPAPTRRRRRAAAPTTVLPSNPARELILPDPNAPAIVLEAIPDHHECALDGFAWTVWVDDSDSALFDRLTLAEIAHQFRQVPGVDACHTERDNSFHVASALDGVVLRRALARAYRAWRRANA